MPPMADQSEDLLDRFDGTRPLDWRSRRLKGPAGKLLGPRVPDSESEPVPDAVWTAVCDDPTEQVRDDSMTTRVQAAEIAASPSWERAVLESWIIAGASPEVIALETGLDVEVIRWYRHLFFDTEVQIHLGRLGPCPGVAPANTRWLLRCLAMQGDPTVLQEVLPTLRAFHEQAVAPLRLKTVGLVHGERLRLLLLMHSPGIPPETWIAIHADVQSLPPDQQDRRAPSIILKRLRTALKPRTRSKSRAASRPRNEKVAAPSAVE